MVLVDPRRAGHPIVFANDAFARLIGYPLDEVIGRSLRLLQRSNGTVADHDAIAAAVSGDRETRLELLCQRRDGSPFWNEFRFAPVRDEAGGLSHMLVLHQDVTARRDLSDALQEGEHEALARTGLEQVERDRERAISATERDRLAAALEMVSAESATRARLMATAGHDLKQPLQATVLLLDSVRRKIEPQHSERVGQALTQLARLGGELDVLARASRAGSIFAPRRAVFPIGDLLARLMPQWQEHASALGVTLRVQPSELRVVSDPAMLSTVLGNLVGNALKFTPRGGRVLVGCRRRTGALSLEVHDDGCGIAADKLALIFEEFERVDPVDGRDGLGLGLSIVKRTAEALGHKLHVRSHPGQGSCFGICVPLA